VKEHWVSFSFDVWSTELKGGQICKSKDRLGEMLKLAFNDEQAGKVDQF